MPEPHSISSALAGARQEVMSQDADSIFLEADKKKKEDVLSKLRIAIEHSLFLEEKRKRIWLNALHLLELKKAEELLAAILRENLRYKKNIRKLKFKDIPERVNEEGN